MHKALVSPSTDKGKEPCWAVVVQALLPLRPSTWELGRQISVSMVYKLLQSREKPCIREREREITSNEHT